MTHLAMGAGLEFDRIRRLAQILGDAASGWGDDVAVVPLGEGGFLVASVDLSVEDVHFRRAWLEPREIGWRAAVAALSDLAAEGAEPLGLLASIALGREAPEGELEAVMCGIGDAARAAGTVVIGGDLAAGAILVVDCCVLGRVTHPVRRHGASAGDGLWVSGRLGGPGAAVRAWREGRSPLAAHRARFARPEPRLDLGKWLAAHGARAMIDLSDGLAGDAGHLAAASGVRTVLELDRVPLAEGITDPVAAAASGEEYELLVAMPPAFGADQARGAPVALTLIGRCEPGAGVEARLGGRPVVAPPGFDHFAR